MRTTPLFQKIDAVTVPVPDLDAGLQTGPFDIPVGRVAVVADPFGNTLVLLDLSKGRYVTDGAGEVTGVTSDPARRMVPEAVPRDAH
jgi:hypothetical protein